MPSIHPFLLKISLISTLFLVFTSCEPIVPQQSIANKQIQFADYEYEDLVGFAKIMPIENGVMQELENPIVSLQGTKQLVLIFDLLTDKFEYLSAKLHHCSSDWSQSKLRDIEFSSQINDYSITDFDYSVNTVQPYINYQFILPKPTISGNYVISIYRRGNPSDLLFTRRFLVVDGVAVIDHVVRVSTTINKRKSNHQIEYGVNYGNLLVNTPTKDIKTVILQNHNWNTAIDKIHPTMLRPNEGYIGYRHLDLTTNFDGWNEFRFADLRTLSIGGRNVGKITNTGTEINAPLKLETSRERIPYTLNFQDINGNYIIENNDFGGNKLNLDYAKVVFSLQSNVINGEVYVIGQFNNWRLSDENRMKFKSDGGVNRYETTINLKQGYYEYLFYVKSDISPPFLFEGSHFQTENDYEILVYYRNPSNIHDELIGYKKFNQ